MAGANPWLGMDEIQINVNRLSPDEKREYENLIFEITRLCDRHQYRFTLPSSFFLRYES